MPDADRTHVHIVGCHRSGTTLMMELMAACYAFDDRAVHERSLFDCGPRMGTYLSKKPPDTIRIGRIFEQDDRVFVIAMVRDPRAVITSRHPSRPDVFFSGFARWLDYIEEIERKREHPRWLVVRYEDLLRDPASVQSRIDARFGFLRRRGRFEQYPEGVDASDLAVESLNGIRPFDTERIDAWRDELPRVKGQLEAHPEMARHLIALGYEPDDAWLGALEAVAGHVQQYKDTRPYLLKRLETRARYALKSRRYLRRLARLSARPVS